MSLCKNGSSKITNERSGAENSISKVIFSQPTNIFGIGVWPRFTHLSRSAVVWGWLSSCTLPLRPLSIGAPPYQKHALFFWRTRLFRSVFEAGTTTFSKKQKVAAGQGERACARVSTHRGHKGTAGSHASPRCIGLPIRLETVPSHLFFYGLRLEQNSSRQAREQPSTTAAAVRSSTTPWRDQGRQAHRRPSVGVGMALGIGLLTKVGDQENVLLVEVRALPSGRLVQATTATKRTNGRERAVLRGCGRIRHRTLARQRRLPRLLGTCLLVQPTRPSP